MKIVQCCDYQFPAKNSAGTERVVEALARAQKDVGHNVVVCCRLGSYIQGVPIVHDLPLDFDIIHYHGNTPQNLGHNVGNRWVSTIHGGLNIPVDPNYQLHRDNYICISETTMKYQNLVHYVHNCIDPNDFVWYDKNEKENYLLWLAGTDWYEQKWLLSAIMFARKFNIKLKIAGTGQNQDIINYVKQLCENSSVQYVGAVNGREKAELIGKAKAVLAMGTIPDAFCLVNVEALVSGTPVIARPVGAHPEILNDKVAIFCNNETEILKAYGKLNSIDSKYCRQYALERYSNEKIAKDYIAIYEKVLNVANG